MAAFIAVAVVMAAGPAPGASVQGQLGILTSATLAGSNPATGAPWAPGDTYRFAFFTSATTTAQSPDIATYNSFVQELANATTVYDIGEDEGVTWKIIGSTTEVDAIDNTSTTWTEEEPGSPIFLLDGSTLVASDYRDLWDGDIQHTINLTELGVEYTWWPWTGTYRDGTACEDHGNGSGSALGSRAAMGGEVGQGNSSSTSDWVWRIWTMDPPDLEHNVYALSDELTITGENPVGTVFRRGDTNDDGALNIADAIALLGFLFGGEAPPGCRDAGDANDDGALNIADAISLLGHLFGGEADLPPPFAACGTDPTPEAPEELTCDRFESCPGE